MSIDISMLLVPGGIAIVVGIIVQLIKPRLREAYKDQPHEKYSFAINSIALTSGTILGMIGTIGVNWGSLTIAMIVTGALIGFVGSWGAIGLGESLGNYQKSKNA